MTTISVSLAGLADMNWELAEVINSCNIVIVVSPLSSACCCQSSGTIICYI